MHGQPLSLLSCTPLFPIRSLKTTGSCCLFPSCILHNPLDARMHWQIIIQKVKSCLCSWSNGDVIGLWSEVLSLKSRIASKQRGRACSEPESSLVLKSHVCQALQTAEDGQFHKAIQLLQSEGLVPFSEVTLDDLLAKHPLGPPPPSFPASSPPLSIPIHLDQKKQHL